MCKKQCIEVNRYWNIEDFNILKQNEVTLILNQINRYLKTLSAENRIMWARKYLPMQKILSSSFGIHSAVSLHLVGSIFPDILIVLIDTGYLFPETYNFIDQLTESMQLNLHVFSPQWSAAWQEARYGKLWEQGIVGINKYNTINKIEPMQRALKKLKVGTWFAGLRREQSCSRKDLPILAIQNRVFKFLPIIDWDSIQVHKYIKENFLKYHPLWKQGYVSVGDIHTSSKWRSGMKEEETRFFGLQRECGLHITD